jgi:hypothetical protein
MVIRGGVITSEARAEELARELHEIVAACVKLYRANHSPDALQLADFTLACWRQALVSTTGQTDTSDCHEAMWVTDELVGISHDDLYLRWLMIHDLVTGSDVARVA